VGLLGMVIIMGVPLSLMKFQKYLYDRDDLTEIQRCEYSIYFTLFSVPICLLVIGIMIVY